ncbi:hypothetical protein Patl1_01836 [Pistacia atlantica]|uniref:Uncharacterized protein n=1 Tax=Pistacia atlantica TaxID=434234 RepID=A0ACC1C615_9ROSI|nr:hypothetical protein Patl1_01836 [Pistacia atlantica]
MFLLCNGILVFIFKNSVVFKKNSPQEPVVAEKRNKYKKKMSLKMKMKKKTGRSAEKS